jgi:transcriptional regulator with XRE-family HTH domain
MSFGGRVREARQDKGLSQDGLAKLLHVKRRTISSWETGANEPSIEMIKKIVKILDVDANFLLGLED